MRKNKNTKQNKDKYFIKDFKPVFIKTRKTLSELPLIILFSTGTLPFTNVSLRCEHIHHDFRRLTVDEKQTDAIRGYFLKQQQPTTDGGW